MTSKHSSDPISVISDLADLDPYTLMKAQARAAAIPAGSTLIDQLSPEEFAAGEGGDIRVGWLKKTDG